MAVVQGLNLGASVLGKCSTFTDVPSSFNFLFLSLSQSLSKLPDLNSFCGPGWAETRDPPASSS